MMVMALTGQALVSRKILATLPLALIPVATMLTTLPAARLMRRRGRKFGFALGASLGILGALVCAAAVLLKHFPLLCLGAVGLGAVNGFATYYRFAAVEVADEAFRSRAISLVMAGGVVAAVLGESLSIWSRSWLPQHIFAGSFICIAVVHSLVLGVLSVTSLPLPGAEERGAEGRPLMQIARQPDFILALVGALASYGVMSFADMALVIKWHILGMYVPSFFTGYLIRWFGEPRIMMAGVVVLLTSVLFNLGGTELMHFLVGLALLGLGWNFLFVSATSLLTTTYEPREKAKVQAANDFMVFGVMALASFAAGTLEEVAGWRAMNQGAVPFLLVVMLGIAVLQVSRRLRARAEEQLSGKKPS
jgi:MFS family permease